MEDVIEKDMTPRLIQDLGVQFATENSNRKSGHGLYECQYCGTIWRVETTSIVNNRTRSCGCLIGKSIITHGLSLNKFYKTWNDMIRRCTNPNNKDYKDYGGRDITVCEEWLDVIDFVAWCDLTYPKLEGYSLDRIDVDGNYEPNNCRWLDRLSQTRNTRFQSNPMNGIRRTASGKFKVSIGVDNKSVELGTFSTIEEARRVRKDAETKYWS